MENIKIKNSLDLAVIDIEGMIGVPEEWQFDSVDQRVATYDKFRAKLSQIEALESHSVVVNIRSTGGDINDAMLIYEALSSLNASITTRCYGYTASAATVIAQAASQGQREISANALYLIHRSTCVAEGNADDLAQQIALLEKSDERLCELYARRSGGDVDNFKALMWEDAGNGRWLSPNEAIEYGLADKIVDSGQSVVSSTVSNIWHRLRRGLGINIDSQRSVGVGASILHPENDNLRTSTSVLKQSQGQHNYSAVALTQKEDPSLREVIKSGNMLAYDSDIRALKRI